MVASSVSIPLNIVGVAPAAGRAKRLSPLPCSKELYPIGFQNSKERGLRAKPVGQYLLERFKRAGIDKAFLVLRDGKWDIPAYFKDGHSLEMNLSYLMMRIPDGVPFSVDQAYSFVNNSIVALGFLDIIFEPVDAFYHLICKKQKTGADIVLGLATVEDPQNWDTVDVAEDGTVRQIHVKRDLSHHSQAWFIAVWAPTFTQFMHQYLIFCRSCRQDAQAEISHHTSKIELSMGDIIQKGIENGLSTNAVFFPKGVCFDIGIPKNLVRITESKEFQHIRFEGSGSF